jgi:hypothetical protein
MKNVVISFLIAACVTIFGPHNVGELGAHITRAGILILRLGLALDPPGYDAGWYEPADDTPAPEEA